MTDKDKTIQALRKEIVHWKEEAEMWRILRKDADRIREGMMGKELRLISAQVKLEADLARVTAERDAAIKDIEALLLELRGSSLCPLYCNTPVCYMRGGDMCRPVWRGIKAG